MATVGNHSTETDRPKEELATTTTKEFAILGIAGIKNV